MQIDRSLSSLLGKTKKENGNYISWIKFVFMEKKTKYSGQQLFHELEKENICTNKKQTFTVSCMYKRFIKMQDS